MGDDGDGQQRSHSRRRHHSKHRRSSGDTDNSGDSEGRERHLSATTPDPKSGDGKARERLRLVATADKPVRLRGSVGSVASDGGRGGARGHSSPSPKLTAQPVPDGCVPACVCICVSWLCSVW